MPSASACAVAVSTRPATTAAATFAASTRSRRGEKTSVGRIVPCRDSLLTAIIPASPAEDAPGRANPEGVPLAGLTAELLGVAREPLSERGEEDERDHPEHQDEHRARRPELEKLGAGGAAS